MSPTSHRTFWLMLLGVLVAASDLTVVTTVLPQIIFDLGISLRSELPQAAWIVNAYLIAYTLVIPLLGRVSDHRGRHAVFMWCLALFAFGSIVAGLANTLSWMIVGRAVQALGAGGMVPVVMAYVGDVLPVERRPLALGIVGAVDTAGWVIGPLYGALMVVLANWRLIFIINLPLSLAIGLGMLASRDANATRAERASRPARSALDWPGALSLTVAVAALTLALTGGQTAESASPFAAQGGLNPLAGPLAFFFVIGLVAFVWAERHSAQPLIPLSLFAERTVTAACIANLLVGAALILVMVDVPIFINVAVAPTLADAPVLSGVALALFTLGMLGGALAGGWLTSVRGYRLAALLGLLLAASGFWLMAQWRVESVLDVMWPGLMLTGLGFGTVIAPLASAVINSAGAEQRGIASALVLVQRLIGMALGLALLTTLGLLRFNSLAQALPPINSANPIEAARLLAQQAVQVTVQVIDEVFRAATLLCALACLPVLFMRDKLPRVRAPFWLGWL